MSATDTAPTDRRNQPSSDEEPNASNGTTAIPDSSSSQRLTSSAVASLAPFRVVRPLVECAEADIVEHARAAAYPILPCNLCGSQDGLRRDAMTKLIEQVERDNPNVRAVMLNALRNVQPSHLLDPHVRRDDGRSAAILRVLPEG